MNGTNRQLTLVRATAAAGLFLSSTAAAVGLMHVAVSKLIVRSGANVLNGHIEV